jgi:hypothetical protein
MPSLYQGFIPFNRREGIGGFSDIIKGGQIGRQWGSPAKPPPRGTEPSVKGTGVLGRPTALFVWPS